MSVTISGTDGISTPPVVIQGSTSGGITLAAPAVAGSNTQTLVAATGTLAPLIAGTAVASTSGTSINFTSIPSWVKRITVMFAAVSTNGTSVPIVQLGDSGGVETTGYISAIMDAGSLSATYTTGFPCIFSMTAASLFLGKLTFNLISGNTWVCEIATMRQDPSTYAGSGTKTLSDTLTQVRITTVNGTDTFDAGTINIMYE